MISKTITSVAIIIAVAAMFISSGTIVNSVLAKSTSKGTDTTGSDKSTSSTAEQDYKDFQKCLSDAEGTNGFATKSEIKSCFNPIYLPATTTTTTPINNDPTAFNN
jgi:hypothetical protein